MKLSRVVIALSSFFVAFSSQAHNIWLEKAPETSSSQYLVKFGHESTEYYDQHKLKQVHEIVDGKINPIKPVFKSSANGKGEAEIAVKGNIVFLEFDNSVWSKLPSGKYVEKTKKEAPTAEFSINPIKIGKAIIHWGEDATQTHNQVYELIPQSTPVAGTPLNILVLHDGKPVKGIKVGLGEDHPFNLTNEQGIAQFTPTKGFNKVWAEFEEKVSDHPDYTDRSYEYLLTFDVK
ncbi:hypothetical protein BMT54_08305 [Pasteurellaceae bacterium 15-036681]|nr:hypothetical protein BMT54_08305 [Pasteurellaceae bacterium 15-036681]